MAAAAPHRIEIVGWGQPKSVSGMTFTRGQGSTRLGGGIGHQASAADADDGDSMTWEVLLDSGTWAIDLIYARTNNLGKVDVILGGVTTGNIDQYGAYTENVVSTITGITVATAGHYDLTLQVNGKNASSSDYVMTANLITLRRTGA